MSSKRNRFEHQFAQEDALMDEIVEAKVAKHQNQKDTRKREVMIAKADREVDNSNFTIQVNMRMSLQLEKERLERQVAKLKHRQKLASQIEAENTVLAEENRKLQEEIRKLKPMPLGFTRSGRSFSKSSTASNNSQRSISKGSSRASSSDDDVSLLEFTPAPARMNAVGLAAVSSGFPNPSETAKPKRGRPVKASASQAAEEIAKLSVAPAPSVDV
jgi:hypothetical protein